MIIALSLALSAALTAVVRRYALRRGVLDLPNARSSHSAPTPRGAGLAIVVSSAVGLSLLAASGITDVETTLVIGGGMFVIACVGWLDDHASVRPRVRLAVHTAVATLTIAALGGLPTVRIGANSLHLGLAGAFVAVLGIVWSINLFNFMDGIDGLAGSEATLVFCGAALLLALRGDAPLAAIAAVLGAASAGFLWWNWPPARIFLGDVGSGALGYAIATVGVVAEHHGSVPLLAVAIMYGAFIGDATVTLARRIARGRRPTEAHRDHAYQRLSRAWGAHRSVTLASAATTVALVALAACGTFRPGLLPAALGLAGVLLAVLMLLVERRAPMSG